MRFCDLFIEYKIEICGMKSNIKWGDLPLYRKICILAISIFGGLASVFALLNKWVTCFIFFCMLLTSIIILIVISSSKKEERNFLEKHHKIYSKERMTKVIELLRNYKIDINDKDIIKLLIDECEEAKAKYSVFKPINKSMSSFNTIILLPIIGFIAGKIGEESNLNELIIGASIIIGISLCIWGLLIAIFPILEQFIDRDSKLYDEFKNDLKQVLIFTYSKK